jgi:5-methyltetrahydropteroyltriglutamate--homocysteine methyltransferase
VHLEETRLRDLTDCSPLGTDAFQLLEAARQLGFSASRKYTLASLEELATVLEDGDSPIVYVDMWPLQGGLSGQYHKGEQDMQGQLLCTTVVGSYPQPDWLIDRRMLGSSVPRVPARELWRIPDEFLEQAQDDATLLAVRSMEQAGVDIISDGEARRESYSNRFATALDGIDTTTPGTTVGRSGQPVTVPRVVGPIRRTRPVQVRDVAFLRRHTARRIKVTIPGPFTMSQQAQNDYYHDEESMALAYAEAVNEEIHALFAAGADVVQLDEPWMQARAEQAHRYAVTAINRALAGVQETTAVHLCFGYAASVKQKPSAYSFLPELEHAAVQQVSIEAAQPHLDLSILKALPSKSIILGVLNLNDMTPETPEAVAQRIRAALPYVPPERLLVAPDCGMKFLPRDVAYRKLRAMVLGAEIVREEQRS